MIASAFISAQPKQPAVKITTFFLLTGKLATIFVGLSLRWLNFGEINLFSTIVYAIGDDTGLVVCFLMLIYGFRLARLVHSEHTDH